MKINVFSLAGMLSLSIVGLISCQEEVAEPPLLGNTPANVVLLRASMTGAAERPTPNNSTATGAFTGSLDTLTRVLSYTVTYSGITPTMGHLHRIAPNATNFAGGVEVPFPSLTSPITGTATLASKSRVDSMLNGFYYSNLHTAAFPGGELRGDITPVNNRPVRLSALMSGAAEKPTPNASTATGLFTGSLDRTTRVLSYTVTYSGLTPTMGHLHRINLPNGNGPVEVPFPNLATPIVATTTLATQGRVDSLVNGFYYSNLHTAAFPGGEIRGDIRVK